jgi:hypothetical protein
VRYNSISSTISSPPAVATGFPFSARRAAYWTAQERILSVREPGGCEKAVMGEAGRSSPRSSDASMPRKTIPATATIADAFSMAPSVSGSS